VFLGVGQVQEAVEDAARARSGRARAQKMARALRGRIEELEKRMRDLVHARCPKAAIIPICIVYINNAMMTVAHQAIAWPEGCDTVSTPGRE